MVTTKQCSICGSDIVFCYKIPTKSFRIDDGKIVRDDAWVGAEYENPYINFHCSNDIEHDIEGQDMINWTEEVEEEFYKKILPSL